ncbi:MAG: AMP-binding protein [Thermaerobacter sp.]|nr:AMP-binding protein [Thermaerobacter sp.]
MADDASAFASLEIAWRPNESMASESVLGRLLRETGLPDAAALGQRAAAEPAWFWDLAVRSLQIAFQQPYKEVLDLSEGPEFPRWFRGGAFNVAHAGIDVHAAGPLGDATALDWEGEDGVRARYSFKELKDAVDRAAAGLHSLGIGAGDAVGIYLPMLPETMIAAYAIAKIGAILVPTFSGYGAPAVAARLQDAQARLLITADGFLRRGKPVAMKEVADAAAALSPTVEKVLVVRRLGREIPWQEGRDVDWQQMVLGAQPGLQTPELDPETTFMIIYTSGTTGRPKGAVHAHCGFPIKAAQDLGHAFDLRPGDLLFWFTDMGWMMGPWAIFGAPLLGAGVMLYEGTPDYPGPDRLWKMIAEHGVTHFGISPTAVRALMPHGAAPVQRWPMPRLRVLGSSGEPWNVEPWRFFFDVVGGGKLPIINYSGGTEISGGIVGCFVTEPIKPCSFRGPIPGIAADVVDETGRSVRGAVGELVLRGVWPGMTRGFWHDRERYLDTYFRRLPGLWYHGDFAYVDEDGFWYILGRSDDTIKVAGKRVGPAEVESALVSHAAVREAMAIGLPDPLKGEVIGCFCVLADLTNGSERLREELAQAVTAVLGKSLKPSVIAFVTELPRTRNGKILRRLARQAYIGEQLGDQSALENPQALQEIAAVHGQGPAGR